MGTEAWLKETSHSLASTPKARLLVPHDADILCERAGRLPNRLNTAEEGHPMIRATNDPAKAILRFQLAAGR